MKQKFIKIFTIKHLIDYLRCLERLGLQVNALTGLGMMCGIICWHIGILLHTATSVLQPKGTEVPKRVGAYTQVVP